MYCPPPAHSQHVLPSTCSLTACTALHLPLQIENEYGYYGEDKVYLRHLAAKVRQHMGPDVLLFTTDGANEAIVRRGALEGEWVGAC
jgi:hypothetical protein